MGQIRITDPLPTPGAEAGGPRSALGRLLARQGVTSARRIAAGEARAQRHDSRLADSLRINLAIPGQIMAEAEASLHGAGYVDPVAHPPTPRLLARLGAEVALRDGLLPWREIGGATVVLTDRPEQFARHQPHLFAIFGSVRMATTTLGQLQTAVRRMADPALIRRAETRTPDAESCRTWDNAAARRLGAAILLAALALVWLAPGLLLSALTLWAGLMLLAQFLLKLASLMLALIRPRNRAEPGDDPALIRLPTVSLLVPLYREAEVAEHLVRHLEALDYPADLLDVCLLLEADDRTTKDALAAANLPRWMRAIEVPRGSLKTKPRALNYGLDFARGSIIGVYDAEDRPAPDQIRLVVSRFAARPEQVACLQGALDFYNDRSNWLARCFTLEYAAWFRVMLPALQRLGLVLPLGGTTLFFRRAALERLGGWDAHNVTEDADLGLRLCRHGYRTEMIATVTEEEANCRALPWVRQRSRWIKGYAITYFVHMRRPARLLADLGLWRFLGVQVQFLGTISQFILAPLLWSFWLMVLGLPHPLAELWPGWALSLMGALFLASEVLSLSVSTLAAIRAEKTRLALWAPTLWLYFPLATLAAWKGFAELLWRPFYWDKTTHGVHLPRIRG